MSDTLFLIGLVVALVAVMGMEWRTYRKLEREAEATRKEAWDALQRIMAQHTDAPDHGERRRD